MRWFCSRALPRRVLLELLTTVFNMQKKVIIKVELYLICWPNENYLLFVMLNTLCVMLKSASPTHNIIL